MTLAIIAAHDPNLVIGANGELPWYYKEDMRYFKRKTQGHPVIMGRGVFEEIGKKPLPGRKNIVLTKSKSYPEKEVITCSSIEETLKHTAGENLIFIIGGGEVYHQMIDSADLLYITEIHQEYEGDTYFPEYRHQIGTVWEEIQREDKPKYSFVLYKRKNPIAEV
ncbi:MAG: dihydrofolate reductase [Balneolaceae bacterium]